MMRRYLHILMILMMGALSACSNTTAQPDDTQPLEPAETEAAPAENEDVRVLVAYFTYAENADLPEDVDASTSASIQPGDTLTGNTGLVAAMIADELDADLFSIQTQERYPDTYDETIAQGQQEQQEAVRLALRSQVEDEPPFEGRQEVLRIIHEEPDPDRRERRIKAVAGGRAYDYLKRQVLTEQRNSGYLQIYYDYVPDTAAAVINRASALLRQEGRAPEALSLLRTVAHDARAWNALGVALYLTGDAPAARRYFEAAAQRGVEAARQNLRSMEATERARSL